MLNSTHPYNQGKHFLFLYFLFIRKTVVDRKPTKKEELKQKSQMSFLKLIFVSLGTVLILSSSFTSVSGDSIDCEKRCRQTYPPHTTDVSLKSLFLGQIGWLVCYIMIGIFNLFNTISAMIDIWFSKWTCEQWVTFSMVKLKNFAIVWAAILAISLFSLILYLFYVLWPLSLIMFQNECRFYGQPDFLSSYCYLTHCSFKLRSSWFNKLYL